MRSQKKWRGRLGLLLFLAPIVAIAAVVAFAVISAAFFQNGTLIVEAQSSSQYYHAQTLGAKVSVGGQTGVTPYKVTLAQGTYTVVFSSLNYYTTPGDRTATVSGGKTSYVVGTYDPIARFVSVSGGEFNATSVTALHGVTPVIWENPSDNYQVISSDLTGRIIIPPMGNHTYIFQKAGTFTFDFPLEQVPMLTVVVS